MKEAPISDTNIEVLNDVTKMLIDSQKGYEKAAEIVEDSHAFSTELTRRAADRATLVGAFQAEVRTLGGEPDTEGGLLGKAHRGFTDFASKFQDNRKAAFDAIDDGEDYLADRIEDKLEKDGLSQGTRDLLARAHGAAKEGERIADRMEDSLDD
ncbi:MAG: PA2169 family four-helix-bundle protein [Pseudomonadota bacterium]